MQGSGRGPSVVVMTFSKGDEVSWNTPQGKTHGTVVEKKTKDFTLGTHDFKASADDPRYVVKSDKTGAEAAHTESALTKKS